MQPKEHASIPPAAASPSAQTAPRRLDRLPHWLNLAANLGVLAGLVRVILQMRQNTELARQAYINEGNVAMNQMWASMSVRSRSNPLPAHAPPVTDKPR